MNANAKMIQCENVPMRLGASKNNCIFAVLYIFTFLGKKSGLFFKQDKKERPYDGSRGNDRTVYSPCVCMYSTSTGAFLFCRNSYIMLYIKNYINKYSFSPLSRKGGVR